MPVVWSIDRPFNTDRLVLGGIPVRFFKLIGLFLISRIFLSCSHKFKVIQKDVPTTMFSVFVISSFLITQFRRENDAISRRSKKMDW